MFKPQIDTTAKSFRRQIADDRQIKLENALERPLASPIARINRSLAATLGAERLVWQIA